MLTVLAEVLGHDDDYLRRHDSDPARGDTPLHAEVPQALHEANGACIAALQREALEMLRKVPQPLVLRL